MRNNAKKLLAALPLTLSIVLSANVKADTCLPSTNSEICIQEAIGYLDANNAWGVGPDRIVTNKYGYYTVTNNGSTPILSFGVTNPESFIAWTSNDGWTGQVITETEWNEGYTLNIFDDDQLTNSPQPISSSPLTSTNDLGSYAELFGSEEKRVNFYTFTGSTSLNQTGIQNGQTLDDFRWNFSALFSNIAIFGPNGQLLAQTPSVASSVSAVPIPAALPLMASALAIFGIARRNKAA